jgi:hypothetical protein
VLGDSSSSEGGVWRPRVLDAPVPKYPRRE